MIGILVVTHVLAMEMWCGNKDPPPDCTSLTSCQAVILLLIYKHRTDRGAWHAKWKCASKTCCSLGSAPDQTAWHCQCCCNAACAEAAVLLLSRKSWDRPAGAQHRQSCLGA